MDEMIMTRWDLVLFLHQNCFFNFINNRTTFLYTKVYIHNLQ
jgi:hypothetical protein